MAQWQLIDVSLHRCDNSSKCQFTEWRHSGDDSLAELIHQYLPYYFECNLNFKAIKLHHPLDGITNPKYKLLRFIQITIFCEKKRALAFNRDRCGHLAFCLWLILFHYPVNLKRFLRYSTITILGSIYMSRWWSGTLPSWLSTIITRFVIFHKRLYNTFLRPL
jgi:hypothetical protein